MKTTAMHIKSDRSVNRIEWYVKTILGKEKGGDSGLPMNGPTTIKLCKYVRPACGLSLHDQPLLKAVTAVSNYQNC